MLVAAPPGGHDSDDTSARFILFCCFHLLRLVLGTAPIRRDIVLKDGPITAFTSSKERPIKFESLQDCSRVGDGAWSGKRRNRAAVETCVTCAAESCGDHETERDRLCSSDAGEIDAAEGGPARNAGGAVYPRCIY